MTNPSEQLARRIACAELMGWTDVSERLTEETELGYVTMLGTDPINGMKNRHVPNPETNPADALALLEVMEKKGWSCKLHMVAGTNCWHCALKKKGEKSKYATCETLPLAIVSAVLKSEGKG